jgi:hypothetical protein
MSIAEFIWSLLPRAYKRVKQNLSEIYMLCIAVGEQLEALKQVIFFIREAWIIETAPEWALELHGKDRNIIRLPNENIEMYRTRLFAAYINYAFGGTNTGIVRALAKFNFSVQVQELYKTEPTKRDQFNVIVFDLGEPITTETYNSILRTIYRVKASHAKFGTLIVILTWNDIEAANTTWDQLSNLTWDEFLLGGWMA